MNVRLVVVGSSAGGLRTLGTILESLRSDLPVAVAIAQHRSATGEGGLAGLLARRSRLPVVDAEDKEPLRPGHVYLAPPDYHMLVGREQIDLSVDEPVTWARPSIDVLLESAAYAYGPAVVGVILGGASVDGVEGASQVSLGGGVVLVQDPEEAVSSVLPRAVRERGPAAQVLPVSAIPRRLESLCGMSPEVEP